MIQNAEFLVFY